MTYFVNIIMLKFAQQKVKLMHEKLRSNCVIVKSLPLGV